MKRAVRALEIVSCVSKAQSYLLENDSLKNKKCLFVLSFSSAWSLSMCDLLLPELKLFISTRRHTR